MQIDNALESFTGSSQAEPMIVPPCPTTARVLLMN